MQFPARASGGQLRATPARWTPAKHLPPSSIFLSDAEDGSKRIVNTSLFNLSRSRCRFFGRIRALGGSMGRTFQRTAAILAWPLSLSQGRYRSLLGTGRGDGYYSVYDMGAQIRCLVTPREASVYVDGSARNSWTTSMGCSAASRDTWRARDRLASGWVPNGSPDGLCHGRVHVQGAAQDGEAVRWRIERATAGRAACITPSGRQRRATVAATWSAPVRPSADLRCFVVRSGESRLDLGTLAINVAAGRRPESSSTVNHGRRQTSGLS